MSERYFANVGWTAEDIQILAPTLSEQEAEDWLRSNERLIRENLIAKAWPILDAMLAYDGIPLGDDEVSYV